MQTTELHRRCPEFCPALEGQNHRHVGALPCIEICGEVVGIDAH